jgi:hypothetical protein
MIKVWVVCFVLFFGLAELYQWVEQIALPLPVYGVAGLLLALLSNPDRWQHWLQPKSASSASVDLSTELSTEAEPANVRRS